MCNTKTTISIYSLLFRIPTIKEDLYLNGDDINKCVILSAAKNPEKTLNPQSSGFFHNSSE
jgi:hypothetical protein